jgi:hypothetical protein
VSGLLVLLTFDNHLGLDSKKLGAPKNQVGHLVGLYGTDGVRTTRQQGRVDRVLRQVLFDPVVVVASRRDDSG